MRRKYPDGYAKHATSVTYTCLDGKTVSYSVTRVIQCKQLTLTKITHRFKWTGTNQPKIESPTHEVGRFVPGGAEELDNIKIGFKRPLLYDEVSVVVLNMTMDDSDHRSSPHAGLKVETPAKFLKWRVELGNSEFRKNASARLVRRRINSELPQAQWETMRSIKYDHSSLCYSEKVIDPEPGYVYAVLWDREAIRSAITS